MDISQYGLRVILTKDLKQNDFLPIAAESPRDVPGTVLSLIPDGIGADTALWEEDWYSALFGNVSIFTVVRWDSDIKSTLMWTNLKILSLGKLPMYIPLDQTLDIRYTSKFDGRPAQERTPITQSIKPTSKSINTYSTDIKWTSTPTSRKPRPAFKQKPKLSPMYTSYNTSEEVPLPSRQLSKKTVARMLKELPVAKATFQKAYSMTAKDLRSVAYTNTNKVSASEFKTMAINTIGINTSVSNDGGNN